MQEKHSDLPVLHLQTLPVHATGIFLEVELSALEVLSRQSLFSAERPCYVELRHQLAS
jgi:hypothetical protein